MDRWPGLDGLRACAVFLVMIGHYGHRTAIGSLGVALFYVLSGFLITWLLEREYRATQTLNIRWFYARRALRIFPALYVFLAVSVLVLPRLDIHLSISEWLASAAYFNDYYSALHYRPSTALTHTWSLGVEEKFYLLWPLLFLTMRRKGIATARIGVGIAIIVAVIWRAYLLIVIGVRPHYIQFAFDTRFDYLAAGCLLALLSSTSAATAAPCQCTERGRYLTGLLAITCLVVLTTTLSSAKQYALSFPLEWVLLGSLLWSVTTTHATGPWRLLASAPLRWLGTISYGTYLYHKVAWLVVRHWVDSPWAAAFSAVPVAIAASALSYYLLEQPFLRLKRRVTVVAQTQ